MTVIRAGLQPRSRPAPTVDPQLLADARGILLDWDGCVAIGNRILPGARRFIAAFGDRVAILSNNSTHMPDAIAGLLADAGLAIARERILLAGTETIRWAAGRRAPRVMMFASNPMLAFARTQGLDLVDEAARTLLLLRDTRFSYAKLDRAIAALAGGAQLVVANGDRTHPGRAGRPVPETGALLAAITACLPRVDPLILGKPGPLLFEKACATLGVRPDQAVMIGDNPDTDRAGAEAFGMASILIGGASGLDLGDLVT
jgi:HAD superfamily hydrolase (TIGR01450 family)